MSEDQQKWFHAIGACGKATANVAVMFKKMGWFVTGSDTQYLAPASLILEKNDIKFDLDYNYKHLTKEFWEEKLGEKLNIPDRPNLCLIVETASNKNKEYLFAKKEGIDVRPFSQILGEYLIKENSIVVIGTAGKTTTTALITKALKDLDLNPSYMIGADVLDFNESLENTESNWSVMEGDEYHSLELSNGAKFLEYKPKYLLITSIGYEHQDVFPSQERYIEEFNKAVLLVPEDGLIIAKSNDKKIDKALEGAKAKVIRYEYSDEATGNWIIKKEIIAEEEKFLIFNPDGNEELRGITNLIGNYNYENILASYLMLKNTLGEEFDKNTFLDTIENFKGPKKRLEILRKDENLIVVDDFGVAPNRAKNSIETLKEAFPRYRIFAVFEPNSGSRIRDLKLFNELYKGVFSKTEQVIIPELSTFDESLLNELELVERLNALKFNALNVKSDQLENYFKNIVKSNYKTLIVFFSSYRLDNIAKVTAKI